MPTCVLLSYGQQRASLDTVSSRAVSTATPVLVTQILLAPGAPEGSPYVFGDNCCQPQERESAALRRPAAWTSQLAESVSSEVHHLHGGQGPWGAHWGAVPLCVQQTQQTSVRILLRLSHCSSPWNWRSSQRIWVRCPPRLTVLAETHRQSTHLQTPLSSLQEAQVPEYPHGAAHQGKNRLQQPVCRGLSG